MTKYKTGDVFPNFTFQTAYRSDVQVKDILRGKTVFWILRYIGCPICRLDVALIAKRYEEFRKKGAQVFVVMQSDPEHVRASLGDTELPFEIICDHNMQFYKELHIIPAKTMDSLAGVRKEQLEKKGAEAEAAGFYHGDYEGDEQQLPALFVVDSDGWITFAHYAEELIDMPDIDEILNIL